MQQTSHFPVNISAVVAQCINSI